MQVLGLIGIRWRFTAKVQSFWSKSGVLCLRACVDVMIGYWLFNQGCCAYMYMSRMKVDDVFTCVRDRKEMSERDKVCVCLCKA
jgi:hypothetical protein